MLQSCYQPELDIVRRDIEETDRQISGRLTHFRAAALPVKQPTVSYLQQFIESANFPEGIQTLCLKTDTPLELVAGVAQMIEKPSRERKLKEFEDLCRQICTRHGQSRAVFEYKRAHLDQFRQGPETVNPFSKIQQSTVINRMEGFCRISGANPELGRNVGHFLVKASACFQDQGINHQTGPFVSPVNGRRTIEIHYS